MLDKRKSFALSYIWSKCNLFAFTITHRGVLYV